jgi:hypothetical protein
MRDELLDGEWVEHKGGVWRVGDYLVENVGSVLRVHRTWSTPIKF